MKTVDPFNLFAQMEEAMATAPDETARLAVLEDFKRHAKLNVSTAQTQLNIITVTGPDMATRWTQWNARCNQENVNADEG